MVSFDNPQLCTKCQGYKTMPYSWNSTAAPRMCTCISPVSLAWECSRCGKINAPWKGSCDCTPTPFGAPTSTAKPNKYLLDERGQFDFGKLPDPKGPTTINCDHKDLK
jgi:hypothetical protein